jgi:outer membrane biosynthesis protein TonB
MIAPPEMAAVEPETPQLRTRTTESQSQVPTRQAAVARVDETPSEIPTAVSQNTQKERPKGHYEIGKFDTDPVGGQPIGRRTESTLNNGPRLGPSEPVATAKEDVDIPAPPAISNAPQPNKPVSRGVLNSRAISLPKPIYSPGARAVGAEGQVSVQVVIDERGRVISANAVSGHLLLRPESERAARNAVFTPTFLSDSPVKVTGVITYNFTR